MFFLLSRDKTYVNIPIGVYVSQEGYSKEAIGFGIGKCLLLFIAMLIYCDIMCILKST